MRITNTDRDDIKEKTWMVMPRRGVMVSRKKRCGNSSGCPLFFE